MQRLKLLKILQWIILLFVILITFLLIVITFLRWVNPPITAVMISERENIKMHIITVANNNISNKQKKKYKYDVNSLKYEKLQGTINDDDLLKLENMIANNSQTFLGSIENMQQLGNFMFNSISCIYSKENPAFEPVYVKKYLKYKKKYLELKRKLSK